MLIPTKMVGKIRKENTVMKKLNIIANSMMMEMYMCTCGMCMMCCEQSSDVLSMQKVNPCTA